MAQPLFHAEISRMVRTLALALSFATLVACSSSTSGSSSVACQYGSFCEIDKDTEFNATFQDQQVCTTFDAGTVVDACPTAHLLGCCTYQLNPGQTMESCFTTTSTSETATKLQQGCVAGDMATAGLSNKPGTWSTSM